MDPRLDAMTVVWLREQKNTEAGLSAPMQEILDKAEVELSKAIKINKKIPDEAKQTINK